MTLLVLDITLKLNAKRSILTANLIVFDMIQLEFELPTSRSGGIIFLISGGTTTSSDDLIFDNFLICY